MVDPPRVNIAPQKPFATSIRVSVMMAFNVLMATHVVSKRGHVEIPAAEAIPLPQPSVRIEEQVSAAELTRSR